MNRLLIDLDVGEQSDKAPDRLDIQAWAQAAYQTLEGGDTVAEVGIKLVGAEESQALNLQYRHKNQPTNVLSFPLQAPLQNDAVMLGDLVVCAPIVREEALAQNKAEKAHWAHMIVHGLLHLQGYDHEEEEQAISMEALEREIMRKLGFPDPYEACI